MRVGARFATGLVLLAGLQAAAWSIYRLVEHRRESHDPPAALAYEPVADPAPALDDVLELPDGTAPRSHHDAGDVMVVHFWATWCAPCRSELPRLLELASDWSGETRVTFLLVSVDESWATVRHYFGGDIPRGVVRDRSGRAKHALGVTALPETHVLRRGGRSRVRIFGAPDWSSPAVRGSLRQLVESD